MRRVSNLMLIRSRLMVHFIAEKRIEIFGECPILKKRNYVGPVTYQKHMILRRAFIRSKGLPRAIDKHQVNHCRELKADTEVDDDDYDGAKALPIHCIVVESGTELRPEI